MCNSYSMLTKMVRVSEPPHTHTHPSLAPMSLKRSRRLCGAPGTGSDESLFPTAANGVVDDYLFKTENPQWTTEERSLWLRERKIDKKNRIRRGKKKRVETSAQEGARANDWRVRVLAGAPTDVTFDISDSEEEEEKVRVRSCPMRSHCATALRHSCNGSPRP